MDVAEENETRITFVPRVNYVQQGFHIVTQQYHGFQGTFNAIPRLAVNNILPLGSPIFKLVQQGRMVELQSMLRLGKASLRDHD
jgi:hypothetical protein